MFSAIEIYESSILKFLRAGNTATSPFLGAHALCRIHPSNTSIHRLGIRYTHWLLSPSIFYRTASWAGYITSRIGIDYVSKVPNGGEFQADASCHEFMGHFVPNRLDFSRPV